MTYEQGTTLQSTDEALQCLARRLAVRGGDAEDLAQEMWLAILRKPQLADRIEWLRIVGRRTVWRLSARDRARARRERDVARSLSMQPSVLDAVETASLQEYLAACVENLKEPYRAVVRLHYLEELSIDEIAGRLGRPASTVRVQLRRGLETLRERLEGRRRNFLAASPLALWRSLRALWSRNDERRVPAGALAIVALLAVAFVLVRAGGRTGAEAIAGAPALDVAAVESPGTGTLARRIPVVPDSVEPAEVSTGGASLSGRVLTHDGRPLAGAPIFLRERKGESRLAAVSGADGRYRVAGADLRSWIEARPEGELPSPPHLVLSLAPGRELDLVSPRPAGMLRGRVLDADGAPVAGAEVVLRLPLLTSTAGALAPSTAQDELAVRATFGEQATIEGTPEPARCATDALGRFASPKPAGTRIQVLAQAEGRPFALEVREALEGEDEEIEVRLPPPSRISGRVTEPDGRACAGARLALCFPEPGPRCETTTDESGRYRFEGLPSGPFALCVMERSLPGSVPGRAAGRIAAGEDLAFDLELSAGSTISGVAERDGLALAGWTVSIRELAQNAFPAPDARETRTGADGTFSFSGCTPSEYTVELQDPVGQRTRLTTRAGSSPLTLTPVSAELVPFHGRIVPGAAPLPRLLAVTPADAFANDEQRILVVDPERGEFTGPLLPRGRYHVDAFFPGFPATWRKTIELDGSEVALDIPARGDLRLDLELPPERSFDEVVAFVRVRSPLETNWVHAPMTRDPRTQTFGMELLPGTYSVFVQLDGHAAESVRARIEEGRETRLTVAPKSGSSLRVRIVLPRPLEREEYLHVKVDEGERRVPVAYLRRDPGDDTIWWASVDLTPDAKKLVAYSTRRLAGELALTDDDRRSGAETQIELAER